MTHRTRLIRTLLPVLCLLLVGGCTSKVVARDGTRMSTSRAALRPGNQDSDRVIHVRKGEVIVRHAVPATARLAGTILEGLDPENRGMRYFFNRNGTFEVEASGRYRHAVVGSVVGRGQALESILSYIPLEEGGS